MFTKTPFVYHAIAGFQGWPGTAGTTTDLAFTSRGYTTAEETFDLESQEQDSGDPWYQITVSLGGAISIDRKEH